MSETDTTKTSPEASLRTAQQLKEDLFTLTKARLSLLVVITSVFGYLLAAKSLDSFAWPQLLHMLFGTILAAFAAAIFNQIMEVDADAKMRRTSDRPLPANRIPKPAAFILGWILAAFGLIHLGMKVSTLSSIMAGLTLISYLFIYTPMKQKSSANTLIGAVSGAFPPLIGWTAGGGNWMDGGALFLFLLLFFWQLPHFAAINWMYREEYIRGGFVMWSNKDESGHYTAKLAIVFSVCLLLCTTVLPAASGLISWVGALPLGLPALAMLVLSLKFLSSLERSAARKLFFFTLLYLPVAMVIAHLFWNQN